MGNFSYLKDVIEKYYIREENRIVFVNNSSLNQMALQMWEKLKFSEIDSSVLSKVINGSRIFTFKQLRVFCELLNLSQKQKEELLEALIKDKLDDVDLESSGNLYLEFAKKSYFPHGHVKLSKQSQTIFNKIIAEIAPKFNQKSKLGIKYSASCYYHFISKGAREYDKKTESLFANFDVNIPICDFNKTVKGLENNCKCGYHLALYGIIKQYLKKGMFSHQRIQNKLNRWISFFFPKESVLKYLENTTVLNLGEKKLLYELKTSI